MNAANVRHVLLTTYWLEGVQMSRKSLVVGILAAGCVIATSISGCSTAPDAGDAKVTPAMDALITATAKLGGPKIEGIEAVSGKPASALYFGTTKVNNTFEVVDTVVRAHGGTATLFAKTGDEYVRVSTNVPKPDGSGRATGTILDPSGKAIAQINGGKPFYGEVTILGVPYITGYEPIKDASGKVVGIWYVGYQK